jgi:hypothetical protein
MQYMRALTWTGEGATYIRTRSARYPNAFNVEPDWTLEAATDPRAIVRDPDPKSINGDAARIVGYSASADCVLTIIIRTADWTGVNAWKTTGADLRAYHLGGQL